MLSLSDPRFPSSEGGCWEGCSISTEGCKTGWWGRKESGDDLDPFLVSGFGRLDGVGVDGGLTGSFVHVAGYTGVGLAVLGWTRPVQITMCPHGFALLDLAMQDITKFYRRLVRDLVRSCELH